MNDFESPWSGKAVLHLDMDAFFAAVEQLDDASLRGLPVIVGGEAHSRGVVSTASYEARAFGVRSAMPSARAIQLCPHAIWVKPRFDRYRELSHRVVAILEAESPFVEPASIDEAYADITPGRFGGDHPLSIAHRVRHAVEALGLTCSIGLATSKTVAKIASDAEKPRGLTVVSPGTEARFLAPLSVRALAGIGAVAQERLERVGIRTLGSLAQLDDATAAALLGSHGSTMVDRARGIDPRPVAPRERRKSLSSERTFSTDVHTKEEVLGAIAALASTVAARLRRAEVAGRTVTVKVRYSDFETRTVRRTLPACTADADVIAATARELISRAWSPETGIRLLGIGLSSLETPAEQLNLLETDDMRREQTRREVLTRSLDEVRARFGEGAVESGATIMRRRSLS